jgi:hypothetical protein
MKHGMSALHTEESFFVRRHQHHFSSPVLSFAITPAQSLPTPGFTGVAAAARRRFSAVVISFVLIL